MYPRVTAIVVAHSGGPRLQRTLDALAAQTRQPDAVIAVECARTDDAARLLADFQPTQLTSRSPRSLPFGAAVATAVAGPPARDGRSRAGSGCSPRTRRPSPARWKPFSPRWRSRRPSPWSGPKLVDWDDPAFIREFGEAMTPFGASVPLVENELDQAQHDGLSDVLAVSSAGMLVRQTLWDALADSIRRFPTADDGLDFCTRARLAGFRVTLVAQARVAIAGDGVAGPNLSHKWKVRRRLAKERRTAQLHRRMVYAPGWRRAVPLADPRPARDPPLDRTHRCARSRARSAANSARRSVSPSPGSRVGAAAAGCSRPARQSGGRRSRRCASRSRRCAAARALKREAAMVGQQGERQDLDFFGTGGGWTVLADAGRRRSSCSTR